MDHLQAVDSPVPLCDILVLADLQVLRIRIVDFDEQHLLGGWLWKETQRVVHHAERLNVGILGQGLVTALVVVDDQLVVLLRRLRLIGERTRLLLGD